MKWFKPRGVHLGTFGLESLGVILGGSIGCLLRFWGQRAIALWLGAIRFPWPILCVNTVGCLVIGILYVVLDHTQTLAPVLRAALIIGLLGGLTTLSSFSLDTVRLLFDGEWGWALLNIFLTVGLGLLATTLGLILTRQLFKLF